jgi:dihydrofolate reductase
MRAIFAVNQAGAFGDGRGMPWPRSTVDLRRFRELTTGGTVVMGSGTWNSDMPKPLPGRKNVVISSTLEDSRCTVHRTVDSFLSTMPGEENTWVIGGAKLLWSLRQHVKLAYITTFSTTDTSSVTLDKSLWLDGFTLRESTDFGDHIFEVWATTIL